MGLSEICAIVPLMSDRGERKNKRPPLVAELGGYLVLQRGTAVRPPPDPPDKKQTK